MLNNNQQILRRVHRKVPNRTAHIRDRPLPRLDTADSRRDLREVQRALALGLREDGPVELPDAPSAHRDVLLRGPGERLPRGLAPAEDGEAVGGGQGAGGPVLHAGDGELDFVVRVDVVVDDRLEEGADLDVWGEGGHGGEEDGRSCVRKYSRVQWECELNHLAAAQQIAEVEVEQDDPQGPNIAVRGAWALVEFGMKKFCRESE